MSSCFTLGKKMEYIFFGWACGIKATDKLGKSESTDRWTNGF